MQTSDSAWSVVATVSSLQEALVLRGLLEGAGLEVQIPAEHMSTIHSLTTALHIRVMVRTEDLPTARQLLDASPEAPSNETV